MIANLISLSIHMVLFKNNKHTLVNVLCQKKARKFGKSKMNEDPSLSKSLCFCGSRESVLNDPISLPDSS